LAQFSRQFSYFRWLFLGHTKQSVQWTVGTKNEVRKRQGSGTVLAQKMRQIYVGQIWCCEVFSLVGNVVLLLICTLLKLNNKSLSLSLVGFPHIRVFPGICLNFCVLWVVVHYVFLLHIFAQQCVFLLIEISECVFYAFLKFIKTIISRFLSV
jgi:hypothetical protein